MARSQSSQTPSTSEAVRCVECDVLASGSADGWKAYISGGFEDEPLEVVIYCPTCAAQEFGSRA